MDHFRLRDVSFDQLDSFSDPFEIPWVAGAEVVQNPNLVPRR
jgi:hypothetical protein